MSGEKIYMVMERRYNDRCGRNDHVCLGCFTSEDEAEKYLKDLYTNDISLYYHVYLCCGERKDGITEPSKYRTKYLYTVSVRRSFSTEMLYASVISCERSFIETGKEEIKNCIDGASLSEHSTAITIKISLTTEDAPLAICIAKHLVITMLADGGGQINNNDIKKWLSNPIMISACIDVAERDCSNT